MRRRDYFFFASFAEQRQLRPAPSAGSCNFSSSNRRAFDGSFFGNDGSSRKHGILVAAVEHQAHAVRQLDVSSVDRFASLRSFRSTR